MFRKNTVRIQMIQMWMPDVEPGYVIAIFPEEGTVVKAGDTITMTVSRGLDRGDSALVPDVVGKTEEEAVTLLGKWMDIQITKEQSADVPAGQVISQCLEAGETADPDQPISLVISSGDQPSLNQNRETVPEHRQGQFQMLLSSRQRQTEKYGNVHRV